MDKQTFYDMIQKMIDDKRICNLIISTGYGRAPLITVQDLAQNIEFTFSEDKIKNLKCESDLIRFLHKSLCSASPGAVGSGLKSISKIRGKLDAVYCRIIGYKSSHNLNQHNGSAFPISSLARMTRYKSSHNLNQHNGDTLTKDIEVIDRLILKFERYNKILAGDMKMCNELYRRYK